MSDLTHDPSGSPPSRLPFESLLLHLRRQGFTIGVDHYLRLQQLLTRAGGQCLPSDLKTVLCPIFATSAEQQAAFYRAFDAHLEVFSTAPKVSHIERIEEGAETPYRESRSASWVRKWPYFAGGAFLLLLVAAVAIWQTRRGEVEAPAKATAPATPPDATDTATPELPRVGTKAGPADARPAERKTGLVDLYDRHGDMIRLLVLLTPLSLYALYELRRFARRNLVLRTRGGQRPPISWPIRLEASARRLFNSSDFFTSARRLHRRHTGEGRRLDIKASVHATIEALGYPQLRYKPESRLPEYLVLIDESSPRDHQARLFENLVGALHDEGLFITTYFFDRDPRVCRDREGEEVVYLTDLQRKFVGHRLLILGDGDGLVDPVTGKLANWSALFLEWRDRAILTPESPSAWDLREKALSSRFVVLPSTVDGLLTLVDYFDFTARPESLSRSPGQADTVGTQPVRLVSVQDIHKHLGEDAFRWLCACAVYPELQWDLTLELASLPEFGGGMLTETNLLRLVRLPWFRAGFIPDDPRVQLIQELEGSHEKAVRRTIIDVLQSNPAPKGTHASASQRLEILIQRLWLERHNRRIRRAVRKECKRFTQADITRVYTELRLEESAPRPFLDFILPGGLKKIIYQHGLPPLGLTAGARLLAAAAVAGIAFMGVSLHVREMYRIAEFRTLADGLSYQMRLQDAENVRLRSVLSREERRRLSAQKIRMEQEYEKYLAAIGVYQGKSEAEKFAMRMVRRLGENELDIPDDFFRTLLAYVEKWRSTDRLRDSLDRAKQNNLIGLIEFSLEDLGLPRELLFIALVESNFNPAAVGPRTRFGIAKGMWQLIPATASQYGLNVGPLRDEAKFDPMDQRHDPILSTKAAALYLTDLYANKTQASGLLVMAVYNYGPIRVGKKLDELPNDPRQRSYWNFYRNGWIPLETQDYVMYAFSAALLYERPELFGLPELSEARELLSKKDFRKAIEKLERIVKDNPGNKEAKSLLKEAKTQQMKWLIDTLILEAQGHRMKGRFDEAEKIIEQVLRMDSTNQQALDLRAQFQTEILSTRGQTEQDREVGALVARSDALIRAGKYAEARAELNRVEKLRPELPELHRLRRQLQTIDSELQLVKDSGRRAAEKLVQGKYAEAQGLIDRWLAEDPQNSQARELRARVAEALRALRLFDASLREKLYDQALDALQQLKRVNPSHPNLAKMRAEVESKKASEMALLSLLRLDEPAVVLLDGQRINTIGGELDKVSIPAGRHKLRVQSQSVSLIELNKEFYDGQSYVYVYDIAKGILRPFQPEDQELLARRKEREVTNRWKVEHSHGTFRGSCMGELVINGFHVEYRPDRETEHAIRSPFSQFRMSFDNMEIQLLNAGDGRPIHKFKASDSSEARAMKVFWDKLEQLAR